MLHRQRGRLRQVRAAAESLHGRVRRVRRVRVSVLVRSRRMIIDRFWGGECVVIDWVDD